MANIEDLLKKQKDRIEKFVTPSATPRKKITRTGPTRPWQENLPQYQRTELTALAPSSTPAPVDALSVNPSIEISVAPIEAPATVGSVVEPLRLRTNLGQAGSKEVANSGEAENKPDTNREQTGDKSDKTTDLHGRQNEDSAGSKLSQSEAKVEPNLGQPRNQLEPKLSQSEVKVEPIPMDRPRSSRKLSQSEVASEKKVEPELRPQVESKLSQSKAKVEPNQPLSALVGLQRNILLYVYESCRGEGAKTSAQISIENLASASRTTTSAARKAVQRIEQKGYITRAQYKDGRGGWTRYAIPNAIYNALLLEETRAKVEPILSQTRAKVEPKPEPQLRPSSPSSSSVLNSEILKTTTGAETSDKNDPLPADWDRLDLTPLADLGFTRTHLLQLARDGKLSAQEVQDSIECFAFDLKRNGKGRELKGSPLNFFMGILRKGVPYAAPENYMSPAEEARRSYLESKRKKAERRATEERELRDLEFADWRSSLKADELNAIVPEVVRNLPKAREESLKAHFEESVWPALRTALPGGEELERMEIRAAIEQSMRNTEGRSL